MTALSLALTVGSFALIGWVAFGEWMLVAVYVAAGIGLPVGFGWAALRSSYDEAERT